MISFYFVFNYSFINEFLAASRDLGWSSYVCFSFFLPRHLFVPLSVFKSESFYDFFSWIRRKDDDLEESPLAILARSLRGENAFPVWNWIRKKDWPRVLGDKNVHNGGDYFGEILGAVHRHARATSWWPPTQVRDSVTGSVSRKTGNFFTNKHVFQIIIFQISSVILSSDNFLPFLTPFFFFFFLFFFFFASAFHSFVSWTLDMKTLSGKLRRLKVWWWRAISAS